ncbi:hypothetical protein J6N69_02935 [bacterium]|nr:hypothetical protein [bacterium]
MINSVNSLEYQKQNPFGAITKRNGADFWLAPKTQKTINNQNTPLGSILPDTIILNPDEARKTNNLKIIGTSIAAATILAAGTIFFFLRGGPKGLAKGFQSLKIYLERKVQKSKLTGTGASVYEFMLGKIDYLVNKSQAVNNFTTIKDFTFKKLMYGGNRNWNYTRKIHNKITDLFEKLGLKTVSKSYSKTFANFKNLQKKNQTILAKLNKEGDLLKPITINGKTLSKTEWLTLIENKNSETNKLLTENFSDSVRQARYVEIKKITKELEQSFDEKGPLWFLSKDTLNTFVAEAKMLPNKLQIQKQINQAKQKISYTPSDLYKDADTKIMKIASYFSIEDKLALQALNRIRDNLKNFAKTGKTDRNVMLADISALEAEIKRLFVPSDRNLDLRNSLNELKELYKNYKQGHVEDILEAYKALLPKEEYEQIAKEYRGAVKKLNKSSTLETEDFINKARDLAMGSAPTDILSVLGGLGTLTYYLGKSDNSQERTAITLKYGIPALVGIGVSLYGNARLFAGTKSLAFATISSIAANRIGSFVNNLYENHLKKTGKYIEPKEKQKNEQAA